MAQTTNYGFPLVDASDNQENLLTWRKRVNGQGDGSANNPNSAMQMIDAEIAKCARKVDKTATIGTSWTGSAAPYSQTITVLGLLSTDTPIVDLVLSDTFATAESEEEDWAKIYKITTGTDSITVYAKEQTTVSLNIKLKVVR